MRQGKIEYKKSNLQKKIKILGLHIEFD